MFQEISDACPERQRLELERNAEIRGGEGGEKVGVVQQDVVIHARAQHQ